MAGAEVGGLVAPHRRLRHKRSPEICNLRRTVLPSGRLQGDLLLQAAASGEPLCWAAERGHTALLQQLLDAEADVNQAGRGGGTALSRAAARVCYLNGRRLPQRPLL